nr:hypothetical protein [Tanacetum cinerariifolium]
MGISVEGWDLVVVGMMIDEMCERYARSKVTKGLSQRLGMLPEHDFSLNLAIRGFFVSLKSVVPVNTSLDYTKGTTRINDTQ